jgi:hypothetical protein
MTLVNYLSEKSTFLTKAAEKLEMAFYAQYLSSVSLPVF